MSSSASKEEEHGCPCADGFSSDHYGDDQQQCHGPSCSSRPQDHSQSSPAGGDIVRKGVPPRHGQAGGGGGEEEGREAHHQEWSPSGNLQALDTITVDTVELVGINNATYYLIKLWTRYQEGEVERSAELTLAFVTAAAASARRCCSMVTPLLADFAAAPELEGEGLIKLASVIADIGGAEAAKILFQRCRGQKMRTVFYHALLKAATETFCTADLDLAIAIADEMTAMGVPHTCVSLRLINHGFTRLSTFSLDTAINTMNWRLECGPRPIENCFLGHFCSILETTPGPQAERAMEYVQRLERQEPGITWRLVDEVRPQRENFAGEDQCHEDSCAVVHYYLVDPFSLNVSIEGYSPPPNAYLVFLFSSVRELCLKAKSTGENHPLRQKMAAVKHLLAEFPSVVFLMSLECELKARPRTCGVLTSPHCKFLNFLQGIGETCDGCCCVSAVTTDAALATMLKGRDVGVVSALPSSSS